LTLFRIATYNVHKCVGLDRRRDPGRIAAVLNELQADVIGLQEVDNRSDSTSESAQMDFLAEKSGYKAVPGYTIKHSKGSYGNALFTRRPVLEKSEIDLTFRRREPRGAIEAVLLIEDIPITVIVTHLGLTFSERRRQIACLSDVIRRKPHRLLILLGDTNEWFPAHRGIRLLHRMLGKSPAIRSFPSRLPLFPLDRIWVKPKDALKKAWVHRSRLAARASDHLPVVGEVDCSTHR
jgi:endonuclease/exonuclease/phosphatase family metal-dependent hydrolase